MSLSCFHRQLLTRVRGVGVSSTKQSSRLLSSSISKNPHDDNKMSPKGLHSHYFRPQFFLGYSHIHTSACNPQEEKNMSKLKQTIAFPPPKSSKTLVKNEVYFEYAYHQAGATKESYHEALKKFSKGDIRRRGVVDFIYTAMNYMEKFGLEKDLETYNRIMDVFPKGPYIPENVFQKMLMFCPHEQACAIDVMQRMEDKGILPSRETRRIVAAVFGARSYPVKKWQRMIYWMGKFWNLNPYPLPDTLPEGGLALAELGLKRISPYEAELQDFQGDVQNINVPVLLETGLNNNNDFILSSQSEEQREMLSEHSPTRPVYVEGGYHLWLRDRRVEYFILRADPSPDDIHPLLEYEDEDELNPGGPLFAICSTSTSCKNSLRSWVRGLQQTNPVLGKVPVLFNLNTAGSELMLLAKP